MKFVRNDKKMLKDMKKKETLEDMNKIEKLVHHRALLVT